MQRILAVDDDAMFRRALARTLSDLGFDVTQAVDGVAGAELIEEGKFDLVITDLDMPNADGFAVIKSVREKAPKTPVVMLTGSRTVDCVSALRAGAIDFLTKPYNAEELAQVVRSAIERDTSAAALLGESEPMRELLARLEIIARGSAAVLLEAEAGVGIEVFARLLHGLSSRAGEPLVSVAGRCCDDDALLAAVERAGRGTLFIDDVLALFPATRATLCKIIERGTVRVVAGTHGAIGKDLAPLGEARLSVPPLRERPEDVPALIRHFVDAANRRHGLKVELGSSIIGALQSYRLPGNVGELEKLVVDLVERSSSRKEAVEEEDVAVDHVEAELYLHDGTRRSVSFVTCGAQTVESLLLGPDAFLLVDDEGVSRHYARASIAMVAVERQDPADSLPRRTRRVSVRLLSGHTIDGDLRWIGGIGRVTAGAIVAEPTSLLVVHTAAATHLIAKSHISYVEEVS
jgi:DNA-binding NtrC family response regulator